MATENASKLLTYAILGAPPSDVSVSKLVVYAIVDTDTPPSPPTARRRQAASILYGKTRTVP